MNFKHEYWLFFFFFLSFLCSLEKRHLLIEYSRTTVQHGKSKSSKKKNQQKKKQIFARSIRATWIE